MYWEGTCTGILRTVTVLPLSIARTLTWDGGSDSLAGKCLRFGGGGSRAFSKIENLTGVWS